MTGRLRHVLAASVMLVASPPITGIGGAGATPLPASLVVQEDSRLGPSAVIRDTATGLDWLDLKLTRNVSTAAMAAALEPGGAFEGFRYATNAELCGLVGSVFAMPCDRVFGFTPLDVATATAFVDLLGPTATTGQSLVLRGLLDPRPEMGGIFSAAVFVNVAVPFAEADRQLVPFPRDAFPGEGSFLVRQGAPLQTADPVAAATGEGTGAADAAKPRTRVPEPAPLALIGLGLLGLGLVRRRKPAAA